MPELTLHTARLLLRPFAMSDAPRVHELLIDPRMSESHPLIPQPYTLTMALEWIKSHQPGSADHASHLHFAVCLDDVLVGATDLRIRTSEQRGWLGYWTGTPYWGKGFATEAAQAVIDHGFTGLGLVRIDAMHVAGNQGSGAVMRKLGMRHMSTTQADALENWDFGDVERFALMADNYGLTTPAA